MAKIPFWVTMDLPGSFIAKYLLQPCASISPDGPLIENRVSTQAEKLVQFIEEQDGKPFDPGDCLMRSFADVICGITLKDGSGTMNPDLHKLMKLNAGVIANTDDGQLTMMLDFFPMVHYLPIKAYDRIFQPTFEIHSIIRKLLRERKEDVDPTEPVEDFMSALLRAKHDLEAECESDEERSALLSEDHLVVTIEGIFLAGYETISTMLRFIVAFLASYPKYQGDIQRQSDEVVGERPPQPSLDSSNDLRSAKGWKRIAYSSSSYDSHRYNPLWLPRSQRYHCSC